MTTYDEIPQLYQTGPSGSVAFENESVSLTALAATVAALANTDGGFILLGIDPTSKNVRGLRDADTARDRALEAGLKCEPPLILPRPQIAQIDGKDVVVLQVPAGLPHAYGLRGKYVQRQGKRNVALGPRQLRQLLRERGDANYEALPAPDATLDDLDIALVRSYARLFLTEELTGRKLDDAAFEILYRRGCLTRDAGKVRPTISGLLLFGREPQRTFPSAEILLARYAEKTMTDAFVRETVRGSLPEQIRRAEAFIVSNTRKGAHIGDFVREEKTEYPLPAAREAIVNAVAHRDYAIRGEEIRVLMFADRIEVYSPGRLPGHVTIDNLVEERFARNEVIVQVLTDLGFVERLGYGIDRMIRLMREWGLAAPKFIETGNGFRVTLRGPGEKFVESAIQRDHLSRLVLNERQQAALGFLSKNQRITNRDYHDLFPEVSEETIRRDLADLVAQGLLLKIGDKRGTYYILK